VWALAYNLALTDQLPAAVKRQPVVPVHVFGGSGSPSNPLVLKTTASPNSPSLKPFHRGRLAWLALMFPSDPRARRTLLLFHSPFCCLIRPWLPGRHRSNLLTRLAEWASFALVFEFDAVFCHLFFVQ